MAVVSVFQQWNWSSGEGDDESFGVTCALTPAARSVCVFASGSYRQRLTFPTYPGQTPQRASGVLVGQSFAALARVPEQLWHTPGWGTTPPGGSLDPAGLLSLGRCQDSCHQGDTMLSEV